MSCGNAPRLEGEDLEPAFPADAATQAPSMERPPLQTSLLEEKALLTVTANLPMYTQRSASFLDVKMRTLKRQLAKQSLGRTLRMRSDARLACLLGTSRFQLCAFGMSAIKIALIAVTIWQLQSQAEYRNFRFAVQPAGSVSTFGILYEVASCLEEVSPTLQYQHENSFFADYVSGVRAAGVWVKGNSTQHAERYVPESPFAGAFQTPPERNGRFELHGQSEDGQWHKVGGSGWRLADVGVPGQLVGGSGDVVGTSAGGRVDLRVDRDYGWLLGFIWGEGAVAVGVLLAGLAGLVKREWRGKQLLCSAMAFASLGFAVAATARHAEGRATEALGWWLKMLLAGGSGWLLWRRDHFLGTLLLYEGGVLATDLASGCALLAVCVPSPFRVVVVAALFGLWALLVVFQRSVEGFSAAAVQPDRQARDELWRRLLDADEQMAPALEELSRAVDAVAVTPPCVQMQPSPRAPEAQRSDGRRQSWMSDLADLMHERRRVHSLDQLYSQALCLDPMLRVKVLEWAAASRGMVQSKAGELVVYSEMGEGEGGVQWAELKKEERAMEKVLRCYGDDVSRLVDVCRQSLVFETVGDMAACLRAMVTDGEVVLVRVKNRMRVDRSSAASAGFRNVSVNLRLVGEQARLFGVDSHVAELQLLLRPFAVLKDAEAHRRYLAFRDLDRPRLNEEWHMKWTERLFDHRADQQHRSRKPALQSDMDETLHRGAVPTEVAAFVHQHRTTLEELLRRRNTGTGARVTGYGALNHVSTSSVLFMRQPVVGGMSKPSWRRVVWVLVLAGLCFCAFSWTTILSLYYPTASHSLFRFQPLESRGGGERGAVIGGFGMGLDGCVVSVPVRREGPVGNSDSNSDSDSDSRAWEVEYAHPIRTNGFWFDTSLESPMRDPVRFKVEGSSDGGDSWVQVGSSSWVRNSRTWRDGVFPTTEQRGQREMVDMRPPLLGMQSLTFLPTLIGIGAALYMASKGDYCQSTLVSSAVWMVGWTNVVCSGVLMARGWSARHLSDMLLFLPISLQALAFNILQRRMIVLGSASAVVLLLQQAAASIWIEQDVALIWLYPDYANWWVAACGVLALCLRWRILLRANKIVKRDARQYDQLWASILADPEDPVHGELAELASLCAAVVPGPVRQLARSKRQQSTVRRRSSQVVEAAFSLASRFASLPPSPLAARSRSLSRSRSFSRCESPTASRQRDPPLLGPPLEIRLQIEQAEGPDEGGGGGCERAESMTGLQRAESVRIEMQLWARREQLGSVAGLGDSSFSSRRSSDMDSVEGLLGFAAPPTRTLARTLADCFGCPAQKNLPARRGSASSDVGGESTLLRRFSSLRGTAGASSKFGYRRAAHVHDAVDTRRAVRSLEQIYSQAICVSPILRVKVLEWAAASRGMLQSKAGELVVYSEMGEGEAGVQWAELKKEERAMEKVLRCYGDDVSRLVDVCRQSVVFETVGDMAACLRAMVTDGEVVLVRVKNRMRVDRSSAASAGFRNVSVNLRLVGEQARLFGVDSHVAELQLLLRPFAELMKRDGHQRYVAFRNIRGE